MKRLLFLIAGHRMAQRWTSRQISRPGQPVTMFHQLDAVCVRCGERGIATGRETLEVLRP